MSLLLDTHIWIWSLMAPEKLSRRVARSLEAAAAELWLSPISIWELAMLVERDRLVLDRPVEQWVRDAMTLAPLREAPVTHEIALESRAIRLPHGDPADRLLAATARVLNLTLVTADERLLHGKGFATLPNR